MAAFPYHFHCRSTTVPRVTARRESVTIVPEDVPVDYEKEKTSKAQEEIRKYLGSLTPYERTNKINALTHSTWPERKARGHLKHTELAMTDHNELIRQAKEVVRKPDRVLAFFDKDGHLQYAFAKEGKDSLIAMIDADPHYTPSGVTTRGRKLGLLSGEAKIHFNILNLISVNLHLIIKNLCASVANFRARYTSDKDALRPKQRRMGVARAKDYRREKKSRMG